MRQIRFDTRPFPHSSPVLPRPPSLSSSPIRSSSPSYSTTISCVPPFPLYPPRRPCLSVTSELRLEKSAPGASKTSYANADNNRTSIREKVNFRGYGCWLSSSPSSCRGGASRGKQRGTNKRPRLYKLRETDDGCREDELVLRGPDSRRTAPSNVI